MSNDLDLAGLRDVADRLQSSDELDLLEGPVCEQAIGCLRQAADQIASLRDGLRAAIRYLPREIRQDVRAATMPDTSKFDGDYKNALADMRHAYAHLPALQETQRG
jgi:hypothetical protein